MLYAEPEAEWNTSCKAREDDSYAIAAFFVSVLFIVQWVVPEILAAAFIPLILLLSWHWFLFLLSSPLAGYLTYK